MSVAGVPATDWAAVSNTIRAHGDETVEIVVDRDGQELTLSAELITSERPSLDDPEQLVPVGYLGISPSEELVRQPITAVPAQMWEFTRSTAVAIVSIPQRMAGIWDAAFGDGERELDGPIGIVGAGRIGGEFVSADSFETKEKVASMLALVASLNMALGIFNLLPLLPLDGGHIAGALYEAARRGVARAAPPTRSWLLRRGETVAGRVRRRDHGDRHVCPAALRRHREPGETAAVTTVDLGLRRRLPRPSTPRRKTRQIRVGDVLVGGGAPISVQSMTTTVTSDINATLQQIAELTATGCQIVRVACPTQDDADALPAIARKSQIPVIADIHFQPKYVFAAIAAGCAAVRVNPGNIKKFDDQVGEIARAAADAGVSIRIGVNAGSLDPRLLQKYGRATPEALVESALWEASLFEEHDFRDFKISVKHNDPVIMVRAYELLSEQCDYPLHLGVTEAGPAFQGTIKSAVAFGALLSKGIGDTIRVSLSAPPVEEVKVGLQILESLNLKQRGLEIVSCPSCGRAQVDVYTLAEQVTAGLEGLEVPLRVAVMGCVVNGPGEAREADLGVASGNGKGQIFVRGEVIKTVPESMIVETLIEEAMRLADEMQDAGAASGAPRVSVS